MTQPPNHPNGWWQPQPPPGQHYPGYDAGRQPPAQPAQPGPTFGGNFQSQQYGGFGAFGAEPEPRRKRSKRPLLIGAVVVVLVAGGTVAAWLLGAFRGDVLDQASLQTNVATVMRDNYGEQDVKNVRCPDDQKIETGNSFQCTVEIGSEQRTVSIRVLNDKPEYEVGAPR